MHADIVVLPGDGIGPEVTAAAVEVLRAIARRYNHQFRFDEKLIGNPVLPALHGGVTAAFLELAAIVELTWSAMWEDMEQGRVAPDAALPGSLPRLPKTIDFTIDYLRSGLARDAYARARVVRLGRRYASVQVEAWQDNRAKLFAQATAHFLMPQS